MKNIFILAVICLCSLPVAAQTIVPSLDPGIKLKATAASAWRYSNTVSVNLSQGSGDYQSDGNPVADNDYASTVALVALKWRGIGLEASSETEKVDFDLIPTGSGYIKNNKTAAFLSFLLWDQIGVGFVSGNHKETEDLGEVWVTELAYQGYGATIRWGSFFFGAGERSVTSSGSGFETGIELSKEELEYKENYYGLAVLTGKPGQTQFRLEYSVASSPEVIEFSSDTGTIANGNRQTKSTDYAIEAKFGSLAILYMHSKTTQDKFDELEPALRDNESNREDSRMGVAWIDSGGIYVGLYSGNLKRNIINTTEQELDLQYYTINWGYRF